MKTIKIKIRNNPIIISQETFLTPKIKIKLRVSIAVSKNTPFTDININMNLEVLGTNTEIQNKIYSIINIYLQKWIRITEKHTRE